MEVKICKDYAALSEIAAHIVIDQVKAKPASVICFASGDTPKLTCQRIVALAQPERIDFSKITFIGLDEWVGIAPTNTGSCYWFFQHYLTQPLGLAPSQVQLFNAQAEDLLVECEKADRLIKNLGGIDLMLVGVGINGHIGFNEPNVSEELKCHVIELHESTITVGQKYFSGGAKLKYGITLGLRHLLESKTALVMASGTKKASIMKAALKGPISMETPASIIRKHANGFVLMDEEAAALLS